MRTTSVVILSLWVVLICCYWGVLYSNAHAAEKGLVLHRHYRVPQTYIDVYAVCDEANQVMVYLVEGASRNGGVSVAAVPNQCEAPTRGEGR